MSTRSQETLQTDALVYVCITEAVKGSCEMLLLIATSINRYRLLIMHVAV